MLTPINDHPARHHAQLTASEISLIRGSTPVLHRVDLTLTPSSRVAIVGENGRGKSTLLYVLAGTLQPDDGTVHRIGTLGMAEQEMTTADSRTVGQAVADAIAAPLAALSALDEAANALARGGDAAEKQYAAALELAETLEAWDAERRVEVTLEALDAETEKTRLLSDLSVGQRYRVRLACLLGADHDFLLLDEPTNHLDRNGLEFLTAQLRERRGGIVIVSHDRALLSDVARTVVDLDPTPDDRPRVYGNGYAGYRAGRQAERERWEQEYDRQQAERTRLQQSLSSAQNRLISGWRPDKGTNKHGRATRAGGLVQNVHRRQEALKAQATPIPEPPQLFRFPLLPTPPREELLSVDRVSMAGRLTEPVSFALSRRSRIVVTGPNGAGKSTLLSIAAGELQTDTGTVRVAHGTRLGMLRQETALPAERRAHELFATRVSALITAGTVQAAEAIGLSQLGLLRSHEANKPVRELSMGQQRRLSLALILAARPQVLLLDEPTNHLSIALVDELTEALGATEAAVVVSTHDRQLLRDVAHWPQLHLGPGNVIQERAQL